MLRQIGLEGAGAFLHHYKTMSPLPYIRRAVSVVLTAAVAVGASACSSSVPPRPVPQLEAKPTLPPWYPEKRWDAVDKQERVFFGGKVVFDTDKATLRPQSKEVLTKLLVWLRVNPDISRIRLEGHTDERATEEHNQTLSEERALTVANWLVDNGLDHNRILAVAFGESRPMASNLTAAGRQENRRTSFDVAEVGGYAFLGRDPTNGGLVLTVLSKAEREAMAKQGEVPKYKPPKVNPERDIFKPIDLPKPKTEDELQAEADAKAEAEKKGTDDKKPGPGAAQPSGQPTKPVPSEGE